MSADLPSLILQVNDSAAARYVTEQFLSRSGFRTRSVGNGAGLFQALSPEPDLILLDVRLPDIDGFELCRRLKADPKTAHIPVLLTSAALVTARSKVEGLDSGADGYLVQPYESAELEATVRALLRMRRAEKLAREALRQRDEFLAVASHELRTPITSLSLQHERMRRRLSQELPSRQVLLEDLARAQRGLDRVRGLVTSLLDFARVESGKVEHKPEDLDLEDVLQSVLASLEEDMRRSGSRVVARLEPVPGQWDRGRLEQVITNLLTNAMKYGEQSDIHVSLGLEGDLVVISVRDSGRGIAGPDQERIFQRFERSNVDVNRPGFGLGLWISREIARALGGDITVQSELGKGATFRFVLPRPLAAQGSLSAASGGG